MQTFGVILAKDDNWAPLRVIQAWSTTDAVERVLDGSGVDYGWTEAYVIEHNHSGNEFGSDLSGRSVDRVQIKPATVIPRSVASERNIPRAARA